MNGTLASSKPSLASSGRLTRCPGLRRRCTVHYKRTSSTWVDDTFLTVSWCKSNLRPEMMESPKNCGTLVRRYVAWLKIHTHTHTHTHTHCRMYSSLCCIWYKNKWTNKNVLMIKTFVSVLNLQFVEKVVPFRCHLNGNSKCFFNATSINGKHTIQH